MTPAERAAALAGEDPRSYFSQDFETRRRVMAGELPEEMLQSRGATTIRPGTTQNQAINIQNLKDRARQILQSGQTGAGNMFASAQQGLFRPGGMLVNQAGAPRRAGGGVGSAALGAVGTLLSGDPLGAAVSAPVGMAAGGFANMATNALTTGLVNSPNPVAKIAGAGLRILVPSLIGGAVQQAAAGAVRGAKANAETQSQGAGGPAVSVFNVPLTPAAAEENKRQRDLNYALRQQEQLGGLQMRQDQAMLDYMMKKHIEQEKAMLPIAEQYQRSNLVNAQAMLASQTSAYQTLGRQATMGKLAQGAQAESGATLRTAISQNPYMGSVIQAPSISFG